MGTRARPSSREPSSPASRRLAPFLHSSRRSIGRNSIVLRRSHARFASRPYDQSAEAAIGSAQPSLVRQGRHAIVRTPDSRAKQAGFSLDDIGGKPVIAILNTWSDANPCHTHFRARAEEVKRGIWQAGGFPMEIPLLTLGETFMKPSTMMYRNLLAMDAEEALRSYPVDGVVLMAAATRRCRRS